MLWCTLYMCQYRCIHILNVTQYTRLVHRVHHNYNLPLFTLYTYLFTTYLYIYTRINTYTYLYIQASKIWSKCQQWALDRYTLPYDIDGIVIKTNSPALQQVY